MNFATNNNRAHILMDSAELRIKAQAVTTASRGWQGNPNDTAHMAQFLRAQNEFNEAVLRTLEARGTPVKRS